MIILWLVLLLFHYGWWCGGWWGCCSASCCSCTGCPICNLPFLVKFLVRFEKSVPNVGSRSSASRPRLWCVRSIFLARPKPPVSGTVATGPAPWRRCLPLWQAFGTAWSVGFPFWRCNTTIFCLNTEKKLSFYFEYGHKFVLLSVATRNVAWWTQKNLTFK